MGVMIVEGKGQFWGVVEASHCNKWGLYAMRLFSNYFEDLLCFNFQSYNSYCSTFCCMEFGKRKWLILNSFNPP